jgi:hypothetical protein
MDAGLMGYFVAYRQKAIILVLLAVLLLLFALWIKAAMYYRRHP